MLSDEGPQTETFFTVVLYCNEKLNFSLSQHYMYTHKMAATELKKATHIGYLDKLKLILRLLMTHLLIRWRVQIRKVLTSVLRRLCAYSAMQLFWGLSTMDDKISELHH